VIPDMTAIAKGIASGMPLGAMVAPADIMNWEAGSHASTFGGNPISCQAALATIELLENELIANAVKQGERLIQELRQLQEIHECIGDVRGKGLMVGIELVADRSSLNPAAELRNGIIRKAFEKGLLLLGCGTNSIRFCPALTISSREIDLGVSILDEAIRETAE